MNLKRLSLTDIKIDIEKVPKKKTLIDAMEAAGNVAWCIYRFSFSNLYYMHFLTVIIGVDVKNKWDSSSWGRKLIVQKRRAALNDFDRFKIMLAKIKVCIH